MLSPFNAFLLLHGMETLPLRMDAHVANAQIVAEFLENDERVSWVRYGGLASPTPTTRSRRSTCRRGPGAVFSFGMAEGREAGERFIGAVELCSHLANVGDTRTLVIHPASTTHRQLAESALEAAGVLPELVRISVGIEDPEDILFDIDRALG